MSETEPEQGSARRGLASRVARVAVTSAALGGLVAAAVAIFAVDRLIAEQADQRLRAATITLGGELDEDRNERKREPIRATIDDENDEIVTSGIRLAVFRGGALLAGDRWVFAPAGGRCETRRVAGGRVRACATRHEDFTLIAAQPIDRQSLYWLYALAALGAILLGAGTGAFSSLTLSRWAVAPLEALSAALRRSRPEALDALDLGPPGDYDEVEAIRAALTDLTRRIQVLLDQAQRFAADAAHELRTPLTALRAELELLAEDSPASTRAAVERASGRVARLSELMERLLVLALPADNLRAGFETVALADVVEDVSRELPEDRRARLELHLASEGLVRGDLALLSSLVANALDNAFKFSPDGAVTVRVQEVADTRERARHVAVRVTDRGPGVPSALRARVFEPFYRGRPGATPGHGIGLALIGHIARAHGGSARFEDVEQGAELRVALPAWSPAEPSA
jgi:signal transduction histidine kinase